MFHRINVQGTENVINACRLSGTARLVLTSSASVVYTGVDISNASENIPYPEQFIDYYTETKALQEKVRTLRYTLY
jgi:sterol-4alpha-carboxylate 3-dehydrogenase (decarboxylating)